MIPDQNGNFTIPDDDALVTFRLASQKEWHPFRPSPDGFDWTDIAHGASRIPRFNGQLSAAYTAKVWDNYVLAQHLCLCTDLAMLMNPSLPVDVLLAIHLHDAEEPLAGLGDPTGPVKHSPFFRDVFAAYFDPILDAIADKAGIARALLHRDPVVKSFDKMAYQIENFHLRGIGTGAGTTLPLQHQSRVSGIDQFYVWGTAEAYENWLRTLNELLTRKEQASHG